MRLKNLLLVVTAGLHAYYLGCTWLLLLSVFAVWLLLTIFEVDLDLGGRKFRSFASPRARRPGDCRCGPGERKGAAQ